MRTATLRGRDHVLFGSIATVAEGRAAIALSRGGAPKPYAYREPNEDAAAFAFSEDAVVLAIADGHTGSEASEVVVRRIVSEHVPRWAGATPPSDFAGAALDVLVDLNRAIVDLVARNLADGARTTLAVVVARPREGWLGWLTMGDSHIFQLTRDGATPLGGSDETFWLGSLADDETSLPGKFQAGTSSLRATRALVLVTDGISEPGIGVADPPGTVADVVAGAVAETSELRPLSIARGVAQRALDAHRLQKAGDNVATAVAWLD